MRARSRATGRRPGPGCPASGRHRGWRRSRAGRRPGPGCRRGGIGAELAKAAVVVEAVDREDHRARRLVGQPSRLGRPRVERRRRAVLTPARRSARSSSAGRGWRRPVIRPARPAPAGQADQAARYRPGGGRARAGAQRDRAVALGEPLAAAVGDQVVMVVARRAQPEQRLQQAVDVGGVEQVLAAGDQGDALAGGRRRSPPGGSWSARPCAPARRRRGPGRPRSGRRGRSSQDSGPVRASAAPTSRPQRVGLAVPDPPAPLGGVEAAADAGVERLARGAVRRPAGLVDLGPDLLARAEAGVDHAELSSGRAPGR